MESVAESVDDFVTDALGHVPVGFFDYGQDGIQDHQVGLWSPVNEALMASATVTTANSFLAGPIFNGGQYRFTPITPLKISANLSVILGADMAGSSDPWFIGVTTVPATNLVNLVATLGRSTPNSFSFPNMNDGPYGAAAFLVSLPEPSCAALCAMAGLLLTLLRRQRLPS